MNIEKTYQLLIQENFFFHNILEYISDNKTNGLQTDNLIPIYVYEDKLEEYILTNKRKDKIYLVADALSSKNLLTHNIFSESDTIDNVTYLIISNHILEMFKNIFKQFSNALTDTQYQEHTQLMRSKKEYFKNNINLRKDLKLEEEIEALNHFLERVSDTLKNSLSTLTYKKNNLSKIINETDNTLSGKIKKLKEIRAIKNKYIQPLYQFVGKKSFFRQELDSLRGDLDTRNKLYTVKRTLDYYIKNYLIIAKQVGEIKTYFNNYISQTEKELYINLGSEYMFEEIKAIANELSDGRKQKFMIWNKKEELSKINPFFKNIYTNNSSENIKVNKIDKNTFDLFFFRKEEINNNNTHKLLTKSFENKQYEEMKLIKEEEAAKRLQDEKLLNLFYGQIKDINFYETEITQYVLDFLNNPDTNFNWHIGHFQFLVNKIIKQNNKIDIIYLDKSELIKKNIKTKYTKIKFQEDRTDEL